MKNPIRVSLFIAGIVGILFTLVHALMSYSLASSASLFPPDLMGIQALLQTFNSATLWTVVAITYFSFRYPGELVGTSMGRSLLVVFGVFYLIRIASEFVFVGYSGVGSLVIIVLCLIPALSYLAAAIAPSQRKQAVLQISPE